MGRRRRLAGSRILITGASQGIGRSLAEVAADRGARVLAAARSDELLRELPALKERLGVNIELASPPDFIPELPGWRERSPVVFQEGNVYVHHFDFYSQALSKIERGFSQDLDDVGRMIAQGLVEPARLRELYDAIEPELYRYPAIDPPAFRQKLDAALGGRESG